MSPKAEEPYWENIRFNAYAKSNYTYEDAELLASLWNIDIIEAKKTIGYKIVNKLEHLLPDKIQGGSGSYKVESKYDLEALGMFVLSPYTYDDANNLAGLWEIDILDAKETIGIKVLNGDEKLLPDKIRRDEEPGC